MKQQHQLQPCTLWLIRALDIPVNPPTPKVQHAAARRYLADQLELAERSKNLRAHKALKQALHAVDVADGYHSPENFSKWAGAVRSLRPDVL